MPDALVFLTRAVLGGVLIASVPLLSRHLGPTMAGLLMTVPIITVASLTIAAREQGPGAAASMALGGLLGLLPLAVFLICLVVTMPRWALWMSFAVASVLWLALAAVLQVRGVTWAMGLVTVGGGVIAADVARSRGSRRRNIEVLAARPAKDLIEKESRPLTPSV